jgi:hypothetical protein
MSDPSPLPRRRGTPEEACENPVEWGEDRLACCKQLGFILFIYLFYIITLLFPYSFEMIIFVAVKTLMIIYKLSFINETVQNA